MSPAEIAQLDGILRAARLLRLAAIGMARDVDSSIAEELDADGRKLDAYSLGLLDILGTTCGTDRRVLRLLVYLLMLCEKGPGTETVDSVETIMKSHSDPDSLKFVELGRLDMLKLQAGESMQSQGYVDLLLTERTSH